MPKIKPIVARNPAELARVLDLPPADAVDLDIRSRLNGKIIEAVRKSGLTHAQVAKSAGVSRPRLTALLNHDRRHVSTDLMLKLLAALGYRAKLTFHRVRDAA